MSLKTRFAEGEKVLCFHGPLLYEAKTLKASISKEKNIKYFIHYAGWNKNWDEWVAEDRVLKFNDANCQRQTELMKQHHALAKNKKATVSKPKKPESNQSDSRASTPSKETLPPEKPAPTPPVSSTSRSRTQKQTTTTTTATTTTTTAAAVAPVPPATTTTSTTHTSQENNNRESLKRGQTDAGRDDAKKKRSNDNTIETEEQHKAKMEIKIKIPDELKMWLADDWNAINHQHKLVDIPAKKTVSDIIDAFVQMKKANKSSTLAKEAVLADVMGGIKTYFNVMLGSQLLYKPERPQYADILKRYPDKEMANVYGAMHLLRLFVKLGTIISYTSMDEKSINYLMLHVVEFLRYLQKNATTLFTMQQFVHVTSEYSRKTQ